MSLALRLARRELRAGLAGMRVFLLCLTLGVAAIAAVGMVRAAIGAGLSEQGAVLLGGDAQVKLTYRFATPEERAALDAAGRVAEVVEFRSMAVAGAVAGEDRALTEVKAVDDAYPLTGAVDLDPPMPLAQALAAQDGVSGAVMEPGLADRLGLAPGDRFAMGTQTFRLGARLVREPDASAGLAMAPRTLVRSADLARSGLIGPGTLFETEYRMALPAAADLDAVRRDLMARLPESGARWSDRRRPAPGVAQFVDRTGSFLVLVGLAGLAVGGVGVSSAVRAWLTRKTATIATLKVLGAETGLIFRLYLWQIAALAGAGIIGGLMLGVGVPMVFARAIEAALPFPARIGFHLRPVAEAAFYGATTALLFTLWPLAQSARQRAAALYRGAASVRPGGAALAALGLLAAALIAGAVWFSGAPGLALGAAGGIAGSMAALVLAAAGVSRLARL
ncbi:MAG: drug:proton antiporter, partial [Paracoccaceae bacterium]